LVTHLIGLLLGTEDDWPTAFEQYLARLAPRIELDGEPTRWPPSGSPSSRSTCASRSATPWSSTAGLLVRPPPGVAQEDRPDGPGLPAQQPVHLPGDGEARRLLSAIRLGSTCPDLAAAPQGPARQRALRPHRLALQPRLRPGRGGGAGRLPDAT
jgi:hypothetical protein